MFGRKEEEVERRGGQEEVEENCGLGGERVEDKKRVEVRRMTRK